MTVSFEHQLLRERRTTSWPTYVWQRLKLNSLLQRILQASERLISLPDNELRELATKCRCKVRFAIDDLAAIIEVFALIREISGRIYGLRHHPIQILGALGMLQGWIIEMRTGEGKTLTSLMTIVQLALQGRGCHVFTANDYLAGRDCEFAQPLLNWFGLTSAALQSELPPESRGPCYRVDVTYGSEKEFAFDFLRDRLRTADSTPGKIQASRAFALIDEADSILIDQASTPMIISCPQRASQADVELLQWCDQISNDLSSASDFLLAPRYQAARLTHRGCRRLRLATKPTRVARVPAESLFAQVERALAARHFFRENHEYLVLNERVEVVDQGTGRVLPGRKWQDGLQQAIEIQAGLSPSDSTGSAARVTLQSYLRGYEFLCGMTGTGTEAKREFREIYGLRIMPIATHAPCRLVELPPRIFTTIEQKRVAIRIDVERMIASGRAVLVGTSSIPVSEEIAGDLRATGLEPQILHARHHREEAQIIQSAGQPGRITVATNMAGRGADIKLHPEVRSAGGLHVILSSMNQSRRIDRQLAGRAGRQGDPGSFQTYMSLEDDLLTILGTARVARMQALARRSVLKELPTRWKSHFLTAQRSFERQGERERRRLLQREQQQRATLDAFGLDPCIDLTLDE